MVTPWGAILRAGEKVTERLLRPLRFGIVGVFNTALGLGVIFAAKAFGELGDLPANAIGYAVGITASFALNRNWTFRHKGKIARAFWRFLAVFGIAYALNLATVFGLRDFAGLNAYVAQAIGVAPYTLFSYWASARYAFSPKGERPALP
jgi:putative flippase GtrA